MTTHYIDITVKPDPESSAAQLLGALYDKLHLALVQYGLNDIGVSFPGYSMNPRNLGTALRLHGTDHALRQLTQADWLKGVRDHVRVTDITEVPDGASHRTVRRKQFKTSAERLRRRRMRRKGETAEQAARAIPSSIERQPNLPYVHVRSQSTGQPFCLFVTLGAPAADATPGKFNGYGLSETTTIPWF
ncbi:MAG: type I-F CRISPR-associated endoribonuclease Cas6/Csy4 [Rhodanobacter sp.]|nr:MAG: type I-F CRISPR-associated endoribonuclease Cas6/Csy4 [Rhodanobacter sp.]TAN23659.1 MAG: type I-F CRISPR-associated endoribonuclease Cas6/Csy4 [Rhodanobacter sp.]